ncbi:BnaC05g32340D [Brassica napus]|uniref:(rape) hypothetical protein n=2 Tax=Brassica napus TaxID=3708 RepID=A0A078GV70_BRANA|nr:unnamed protein product [Brassica napus]CDY29436.1 BnaC05g32340D [Brassica napus]
MKFVRTHDHNRSIRFEALQSKAGNKLLMQSGRAPDDIYTNCLSPCLSRKF